MSEDRDESWHRQRTTYAAALLVLASLIFSLSPLLTLFTQRLLFSALWLGFTNVAMMAIAIHAYRKVHDRTILAGFGLLVCLEVALLAAILLSPL